MPSQPAPTPANGEPHRVPRGAAPTDQEVWFGENLRRLREEREISQSGLAREMAEKGFAFHQTTISRIEAGERPVRLAEAIALASIVGTDIGSLTLPPSVATSAMSLREQRERVSEALTGAAYSLIDLWKERIELERSLDQVDRPESDQEGAATLRKEIELTEQLLEWTTAQGVLKHTASEFYDTSGFPYGAVRVKGEISDILMTKLHDLEAGDDGESSRPLARRGERPGEPEAEDQTEE